MTELLNWMAEHPFLTLLLGWVQYACVWTMARHLTLLVRGWPPAGLDADGDML